MQNVLFILYHIIFYSIIFIFQLLALEQKNKLQHFNQQFRWFIVASHAVTISDPRVVAVPGRWQRLSGALDR